MSTKYDRQLIVQFLGIVSVQGENEVIQRGSSNLQKLFLAKKRAVSANADDLTPIFTVDHRFCDSIDRIKAHLPRLTAKSRIYLRGHGDFKNQKLGGFLATQVFNMLFENVAFHVGRVSVTGCSLARPDALAAGTDFDPATSLNTFPGRLFDLLSRERVDSMVARVHNVQVTPTGHKQTRVGNDWLDKRGQSKVMFEWKEAVAASRWYVYGVDDKDADARAEDTAEQAIVGFIPENLFG
jgi:hypothetical protein